LEGPLSPQDNAYDLMRLTPRGDRLFEMISRYDDLLAMEGRQGYEPGDTLALIVPFLLLHGIAERNITELACKATLTQGARELLSGLAASGWQIFCITTTYEQYARHITGIMGIPFERVACTPFPLDAFAGKLSHDEIELFKHTEQELLSLNESADDHLIKSALDDFFWTRLPRTPAGEMIRSVKPIGGRRKLQALTGFSEAHRQPLSKWAVVGDSITDSQMLGATDQAGGLSVAFNGNQYALPYATLALASTHLSDMEPILNSWREHGRSGVTEELKHVISPAEKRRNFTWLADGDKDIQTVIALHRRLRRLVREKAGELG